MIRSKLFLLPLLLLVATCSSASSLNPLKGVTILLDPGHGGTDPGAIGPSGLKESETNLRVARYLRDLLRADGAEVHMTRDNDKTLSLGERVEHARRLMPDLFVSIHHNASLKPRKTNRSEIYFNALDQGLSQKAGKSMIEKLENFGFGEESIIVPGGFFVLRNNPAPSVLTEGSYISIPDIERQLKTGKALTNQAEALRRAIRETFVNGPLQVKVLVAETPAKIDTSFFNFIFSANKPVAKVRARLSGSDTQSFGFDRISPFGYTYRLYNRQALKSGFYDLQLTFHAEDGTVAPRISVPLEVHLPLGESILKPIAPYIPTGFKGKFPVIVKLKDQDGRENSRSVPVALFYKEKSELIGKTDASGRAVMLLDLDGNEQNSLEVRIVHDSEILSQINIPVRKPVKRFFLGRILDHNLNGLAGVKIAYGLQKTESSEEGYFFAEYPLIYDNMKFELKPPLGFQARTAWIRTQGEPVYCENLEVSPVSTRLLGKKIGIMAPMSFDNLIRVLVRELMTSGAEVTRLNMPEQVARPEYQAVLEANLKNNLDLIVSFKLENAGNITARHYHRGGKGKLLADQLAFSLLNAPDPIKIKVSAGSDYEISHTGTTSIVLAFPQLLPPEYPETLVMHLVQVLKSVF